MITDASYTQQRPGALTKLPLSDHHFMESTPLDFTSQSTFSGSSSESASCKPNVQNETTGQLNKSNQLSIDAEVPRLDHENTLGNNERGAKQGAELESAQASPDRSEGARQTYDELESNAVQSSSEYPLVQDVNGTRFSFSYREVSSQSQFKSTNGHATNQQNDTPSYLGSVSSGSKTIEQHSKTRISPTERSH